MKLNLKPGMRLKNKGGDNVEILKTDYNAPFNNVFCVLAISTDKQGLQTVHTLSFEGRSSSSRPGTVCGFDISNPYEDLKNGDPVFVRDDDEEKWERRHFCRFEDKYIACCPDGKTGWGCDTSCEALTYWKEVRIPTEEELKTRKVID